MTNNVCRLIGGVAIAVASLGVLISDATSGSFMRGCAARDMQILVLIEESEGANVASQKLNDAVLDMMHARMVCYEGRVADALALYDTIARSLVTDPILSERMDNAGDAHALQ